MVDFFVKNDPKLLIDGPNRRFWYKFACETARLGRLYPYMKAKQRVMADGAEGEWMISGPPAAVHSLRGLFALAARKIGFHGGDEGAVQFWLDHMNGKHILKRSPKPRKDDERESQVRYADGHIERFRGRQRIG